jgi:hypothetical protein
MVICALIVLSAYVVTKGFAFNYTNKSFNPEFSKIIKGVHIVLSILIGLILPNNYLNKIEWINNLYNQSYVWIPISMILITLLLLIIIGTGINLFLEIVSRNNK